MRTVNTLIRLGGCPGWSESSLGAHSLCWFCHVAAQVLFLCQINSYQNCYSTVLLFLVSLLVKKNEPTHEIMALITLRKLILQTTMHSNPLGLHVWYLVRPFVYFHTLCVRIAKALARLRGCPVSPEPSLFAYAISSHELAQIPVFGVVRPGWTHTGMLSWPEDWAS